MGPLILFAVAVVLLVLAGTAALVRAMQRPPRKTYAYVLANGLPCDPAELGLSYTEQQFTFPDGSSTMGWLIEGADPAGPIVVVSHGWGSSRYGSLGRVPLLTGFASRVVVYDARPRDP